MIKEPIRFVAQFVNTRITKDGGGRLTLEFGIDALPSIQELMGLGNVNLAFACVPFTENYKSPDMDKISVDENTGEIILEP